MNKDICQNCTYYTAYYKKLSSLYSKLNHGYCRKQCKPQIYNNMCEEYHSNDQKERSREATMFRDLERAVRSINEITLIMKEKVYDISNIKKKF